MVVPAVSTILVLNGLIFPSGAVHGGSSKQPLHLRTARSFLCLQLDHSSSHACQKQAQSQTKQIVSY